MGWEEYFAVRSITVYENKGIAKPLLSLIAFMIEGASEAKEPTPNEGYCFASVRYLAESLGCSEASVEQWIGRFITDGWLVKETLPHDRRGHQHNRYRLANNAMDRLKTLKRINGEKRQKNPNKVRTIVRNRFEGKFAPRGA